MGFEVIKADGSLKQGSGVSTAGTPADNYIAVFTNASTIEGTSAFQFDGTTLTIPGQIKFPATQSASSDVNTLDDYEEGTWTPVLGGDGGTSGQTYTHQIGRYVKIGLLVFINARITFSAKGTITGSLQLQGLPFTAENITSLFSMAPIGYFASFVTNWSSMTMRVDPNTTTGFTMGVKGTQDTSISFMDTNDVGNTSSVGFFLLYRATA